MGIDFSIDCVYLVDRFVKFFRLKSIITTIFFLTTYLASYGVNVPPILVVIGMTMIAILMNTINRSEIEY
ncbi:hypothetical protein [Coxiella endosymbiont of Ornithodoros amblus]|uniref:hypothetical protein n=1 Tax=Coxiella endosymbiont of Ornithodoros amblus TaxID=1656166 RepID=UPI00244DA9DE|nr:hypothetical protein [Coxiella endosymbiont of Ornithodoros amblus]